MTGNGTPDGISASTGIFVCGIKGAYKFDFQGEKVYTHLLSNFCFQLKLSGKVKCMNMINQWRCYG